MSESKSEHEYVYVMVDSDKKPVKGGVIKTEKPLVSGFDGNGKVKEGDGEDVDSIFGEMPKDYNKTIVNCEEKDKKIDDPDVYCVFLNKGEGTVAALGRGKTEEGSRFVDMYVTGNIKEDIKDDKLIRLCYGEEVAPGSASDPETVTAPVTATATALDYDIENKKKLATVQKLVNELDLKQIPKYGGGYIQNPIGIVNPHNTCYLNSMLQLIVNNNKFIDILFMLDNKNVDERSKNAISEIRTFYNNYKRSTTVMYTNNLEYAVNNYGMKYKVQNDPTEFFALIFATSISNHFLDNDKHTDSSGFSYDLFYHTIGATLQSSDWCKKNNVVYQISDKWETLLIMDVELETSKDNIKISSLIDKFQKEEKQDQQLESCEGGMHVKMKKTLYFNGDIACVSLKRYRFSMGDQNPTKIQDAITIEEQLILQNIHNKGVYYNLYGIICHKGETPNSGHYVAYLKKNNEWYYCDDMKVNLMVQKPFLEESVKKNCLFFVYEKSNNDAIQYIKNSSFELKDLTIQEINHVEKNNNESIDVFCNRVNNRAKIMNGIFNSFKIENKHTFMKYIPYENYDNIDDDQGKQEILKKSFQYVNIVYDLTDSIFNDLNNKIQFINMYRKELNTLDILSDNSLQNVIESNGSQILYITVPRFIEFLKNEAKLDDNIININDFIKELINSTLTEKDYSVILNNCKEKVGLLQAILENILLSHTGGSRRNRRNDRKQKQNRKQNQRTRKRKTSLT